MFATLWAGADPPGEYLAFRLSDRFGWTPEQIRQQRAADILDYLTIMDVETKVQKRRRLARGQLPKGLRR